MSRASCALKPVDVRVGPWEGRPHPAVPCVLGLEDGPGMLQEGVLRQRPLQNGLRRSLLFQDGFPVVIEIKGFQTTGRG